MTDDTNMLKGGRGKPPISREEMEDILRKLEPYLQSGLSVNKACYEAKIPKSTVFDLIKENDEFAEKIQGFKQYLSVLLSRTTVRELNRIAAKQQKLVIKESKDETILPSDLLTKEDKDFLQWFALHHTSTREEFSDRKDIGMFDPQEEIRRLGKLIDDEGEDEDDEPDESSDDKEE